MFDIDGGLLALMLLSAGFAPAVVYLSRRQWRINLKFALGVMTYLAICSLAVAAADFEAWAYVARTRLGRILTLTIPYLLWPLLISWIVADMAAGPSPMAKKVAHRPSVLSWHIRDNNDCYLAAPYWIVIYYVVFFKTWTWSFCSIAVYNPDLWTLAGPTNLTIKMMMHANNALFVAYTALLLWQEARERRKRSARLRLAPYLILIALLIELHFLIACF